MDLNTAAVELRKNIARVGEKDRQFVESILSAYFHGRSSEKQDYYILAKYDRWIAPKASEAEEITLATPRIVSLFKLALENGVEKPTIHLSLPEEAGRIVLRFGYSRDGVARIFINDRDRKVLYRGVKRGASYGAIALEAGVFVASKYADKALVSLVLSTLASFELDPQKVGAMEGHATGQCCFCGLKLKTAASVAAGYGPTCANNFGLPWGEGDAKQNLQKALAAFTES